MKSLEIKRTSSLLASRSFSLKKVYEFVAQIKEEIFKIQWTSQTELKSYAKAVVIATFLGGMVLYLMDLTIQGLLNLLFLTSRLSG